MFPWGQAWAQAVGYAQSSGYFLKEQRPSLYQPLHLLDGLPTTAWCSESVDTLNQLLTIGFKQAVSIDEVRIFTGHGFAQKTFDKFGRAKKILIRGDGGGRNFQVADERELQSISFQPPLSSSQFRIEILDLYPGADVEAPVCISDLVFYSKGKALNGEWLRQKLKFNPRQAKILGTWFGGYEGAPDRFLSFYFDGTYSFEFRPFDTQKHKPQTLRGRYRVVAERIVFEFPRKKRVVAQFHKSKKDSGQVLVLEGKFPSDFGEEFRDFP